MAATSNKAIMTIDCRFRTREQTIKSSSSTSEDPAENVGVHCTRYHS